MNEREVLEAICESCRRLHARNLLAAGDGNIAFRFGDHRIVMTPAGVNKAKLRASDLAWMRLDGTILSGRPSSERAMHLALLKAVPEARAVVHAHPPIAIAWSLAHPEMTHLPDDAIPEAILAAGRIPIVPYARPGTDAMGRNLLPFLPQHRLMILARHGALCWGETVEDAYNGIERLEHLCLILKQALEMGGTRPLPPEELEALRKQRDWIGPRVL
ncbi:MAG: class II aldolase/adducin family protein [Acidobacteria bacterium]|nr:class II aldolase/adducin family protein [Acidobacteriota bacterium]